MERDYDDTAIITNSKPYLQLNSMVKYHRNECITNHMCSVYKIHVPLQRNRRLKRQAHQCVPAATVKILNRRGENRQLHTLIERKTPGTHEHAHTKIPTTWVPRPTYPLFIYCKT